MTWWLRLKKRRSLDRDLDDEIAFHRAMRAGDSGSPPPFGNTTLIKETIRDMWRFRWIEGLGSDVRYALRGMRRNSVFTITAVLLIALAVGMNTAMFTVVKRVLLDPLPYPDSDRLVRIWELQKKQGIPFSTTSFDYVDWAARSNRFRDLTAYSGRGMALTGEGEPELIIVLMTSANFFRTLGVHPMLGRDFRPEENERGHDRVIVLSDSLWRRKFGGDPSIVGRNIRLNSEAYEVIGVMPRGFSFPEDRYAAWAPLALKGGDPNWTNRSAHYLRVLGRLKPSESIQTAGAELESIAAQLESAYPETNRNIGVRLQPLKDNVVGDSQSSILLLYGAVTLLLLIACSNVAGLLLARSAGRKQEFAIRTALGAGRLRLARQMFVETTVLSLAGGAAGVVLAEVLLAGLRLSAPETLPRVGDIRTDTVVLVFSVALSILTGLLFGLAPAFTIPRLVQSVRGAAATGLRQRARSTLVVAQVALAVLLLAGAGLVLRSFYSLTHVDLGYRVDGVVTMGFALDENAYPTTDSLFAFTRQLDEGLRATPQIRAAGFSTTLPLSGQGWGNPVVVEGTSVSGGRRSDSARIQSVSPRFFQALDMPLRIGRQLTVQDNEHSPHVAIVDETFVRVYMNDGRSPLGRRLKLGGPESEDAWRTVVGVVAETRQLTLDGPLEPQVYLPYLQMGDTVRMVGRGIYVAARANTPSAAAGLVKAQIAAIDRNLPVRDVQLLSDRLDSVLAPQRFRATLMSAFAALALLLAAVGLYGVIAFAVSQRTQEIGVRMALGAEPRRIARMIVSDGLRLALIGLVLGLAAAMLLSRWMERNLFGVRPNDFATLAGVAVMLCFVALVASYLPARRATSIDPMSALRIE